MLLLCFGAVVLCRAAVLLCRGDAVVCRGVPLSVLLCGAVAWCCGGGQGVNNSTSSER